MTRKSVINRWVLSVWPGWLLAGIPAWAQSQDPSTNYVVPTTLQVGFEQNSAINSYAGYIRVLEESQEGVVSSAAPEIPPAQPQVQAPAPTADVPSPEAKAVISTSKVDPTSSDPKPERGPIQTAPLTTPSTRTEGLGTGVRPEDVTVGRLPPAQWLPTGQTRDGYWGLQAKPWVPGGFCHQPLYFEDPMLERHGHERFPHLQPLVSGVRFFGTIPVLPYLATLRHPLDDVHTLGSYSPGTVAPMLRYRAHYDPAALRNQIIVGAGAAVLAAP